MMGRIPELRRVAAAIAAIGASLAATPVRAEPTVRVLLLETSGSVSVRDGSRSTRIEPGDGGLVADSKLVGPVWRFEGDGVMRAAADRTGSYRVRGALEVHRVPTGLQVVNWVGLEDYVAGTVGREVFAAWDPQMLRAQAVVARTYESTKRRCTVATSTASWVSTTPIAPNTRTSFTAGCAA